MPTYITTSWDDGHPADLRVAEMLARHRLRGTFYVPRSIESGVMTASQLRELARGFEIGAHTLNHVFLDTVDASRARDEIIGSRKWVQEATGQPCPMFCPPAGRYNRTHLPMFREAGFTGFRTVEFLSLDMPRPRHDLLEMPTTLHAYPQPLSRYARNMTRRLALGNWWRFVVHGHSREWAILARRLLKHAIRVGGVFHLWGHSWELEETQQWTRLEEVFKLFAEVQSQAACLTNGQVCGIALEPAVGVRRGNALGSRGEAAGLAPANESPAASPRI
jgi:hypothetical protein